MKKERFIAIFIFISLIIMINSIYLLYTGIQLNNNYSPIISNLEEIKGFLLIAQKNIHKYNNNNQITQIEETAKMLDSAVVNSNEILQGGYNTNHIAVPKLDEASYRIEIDKLKNNILLIKQALVKSYKSQIDAQTDSSLIAINKTVSLSIDHEIIACNNVINKFNTYYDENRSWYFISGIVFNLLNLVLLISCGFYLYRFILIYQKVNKEIVYSDERLKNALETTQVGIFEYEPASGNMYFSPQWYKQLGFDGIGINWSFEQWKEMIHPEDLNLIIEKFKLLSQTNNYFKTEIRLRNKFGDYLWFIIIVNAAAFDDFGNPIRISCSQFNIDERKKIEIELKENKDLFRQMIDNLQVSVAYIDKNEKFVVCNRRFEKSFGLPIEEIEGNYVKNIIPYEAYMNVKVHIDDVFVNGQILEMNNTIKMPDNTVRFIKMNFTPRFVNSQIVGAFTTIINITEDVKLKNQLIENEEKLRFTFNQIPGIFWVVDKNLTFTHLTGSSLKYLKIDNNNYIGKSLNFNYDKRDIFTLALNNHVKALEGVTVNYVFELDNYNFDVFLEPFKNKENEIIGVLGIALDVTEKLQAQILKNETEAKYKLMWDNLYQAAAYHRIIVDENEKPVDYVYIDVNDSFCEMFNISKEEILQKKVSLVFPNIFKDNFNWIKNYGELALSGGKDRFVHLSESINKWLSVVVYCPKKYEFISIFDDITEQVVFKQQLENMINELEIKNSDLERFNYTISHDLSTPIVTIKGFLGMLKLDLEAGNMTRVNEDLKRIENAANRMKELLDNMLELSKLGRIVNQKQMISMKDVIDDCLELSQLIIDEKNVKIVVQQEMPNVRIDRSRISEVWQNLIENAIKFSAVENNQALIEIGCKYQDSIPVFFIKDNGIGIAPQYHKKIFGMFEKLNDKFYGAGIGLALVKRIIELHNGTIWVESDGNNNGSTFYFTIE